MIILIDAYNILKQISSAKTISSAQRAAFVNKVAAFVKNKGHKAVIAFDGVATEESQFRSAHSWVRVIYSGPAQADDVLKKLCQEYAGHEVVLVSADRELVNYARHHNVTPLDPLLFYDMITKEPLVTSVTLQRTTAPLIKRPGHETLSEVDVLMQDVSVVMIKDETVVPQRIASKALSKREKTVKKILDKL